MFSYGYTKSTKFIRRKLESSCNVFNMMITNNKIIVIDVNMIKQNNDVVLIFMTNDVINFS